MEPGGMLVKCALMNEGWFGLSVTVTLTGTSTVSVGFFGVHTCVTSSHVPSIFSNAPVKDVTSTVCTGPPWNLISVKPLPGPGSTVITPVGLSLMEPVIV